jgi:lysophospholipase L1-like esterase
MIRFFLTLLFCFSTAVAQTVPTLTRSVGSLGELAALSPSGLVLIVLTNDAGGTFRYDITSTAATNATTVVRPNSIASGSPGRWHAVSTIAGVSLATLQSGGGGYDRVLTNAGTAYGLTLQGITTNAPSLSVKALGATGSGDDTLTIASTISKAQAQGAALDLAGGIYTITNLAITAPLTIRNGTLKAITTFTNTSAFVNVTGSNVVFDHVNIDGDSKALRGLRLDAATGFRWVGGKLSNFLQPTGFNAQAAGVMITDGSEFVFTGGWMVSNVVAVADGDNTGNEPGTARGFLVVSIYSGTNTPPQGIIEDGTIAYVQDTGSNLAEDCDGIGIHSWGTQYVPITLRSLHFVECKKRWIKKLARGVMIDDIHGTIAADGTNYTQFSAISDYGGGGSISRVRVPLAYMSYGIEANNNANVIGDVLIQACQIGVDTGGSGVINPNFVGIKSGGALGVFNVRLIGNTITNAWLGIHIGGGVTNYSVLANQISASEEGVMDGNRTSSEATWTTNQLGIFVGNVIYGTPTGGSIRFKRTANVTPGINSVPASYPITFDNGYAATVLSGYEYLQNLVGGSATNLDFAHIGNTITTLSGIESPEVNIQRTDGTNVMILLRQVDGTYNRALLIKTTTNGIQFDTTQTTGGNDPISFSQAGSDVLSIDASGNVHGGPAASGTSTIFLKRNDTTIYQPTLSGLPGSFPQVNSAGAVVMTNRQPNLGFFTNGPVRIIFVGHSHPAGTGATATTNAYPSRFMLNYAPANWEYKNVAVSGYKISDVDAIVSSTIAPLIITGGGTNTLIVLDIGYNDYNAGGSNAVQYINANSNLVARFHTNGAYVAVIGVNGAQGLKRTNDTERIKGNFYLNLATWPDWIFNVQWWMRQPPDNYQYINDGLHFNDQGHLDIAEGLYYALTRGRYNAWPMQPPSQGQTFDGWNENNDAGTAVDPGLSGSDRSSGFWFKTNALALIFNKVATYEGDSSSFHPITGASKQLGTRAQSWLRAFLEDNSTIPTNGLQLFTTTAAANGTQRASPALILEGRGWSTGSSASQPVQARFMMTPVQGSSPTGNFVLDWSINGGAFGNGVTFGSDGSFTASAGAFATSLTINGANVSTATSADTLQNKSFDAADTGNTLKLKGYIQLIFPHTFDGAGAVQQTADATKNYFGHALFSGTAASTANWVEYRFLWPPDLDTASDLKLTWKVQLSGADTAASTYFATVASVADSASAAGSLANSVTLTVAADAVGASGDVETVSAVTATGWKSAITPGQLAVVRIARDGSNDASTVGAYDVGLMIEYGITQ